MIENKLFRHFGIEPATGICETKTVETAIRRISDGILDNDFIAIYAAIGTGKSAAARHAMQTIKAQNDQRKGKDTLKLITMVSTGTKGLTYGDILDEIIEETQADTIKQTPNRSIRARAKQVSRIMVMCKRAEVKVCVVIDRAHFLHFETIKALKGLRELDFFSPEPLFSLILIGEPSLQDKINRDREIRIRIKPFPMQYSHNELKDIYRFHSQGIIEEADLDQLVSQYKRPGEFIHALASAMEHAMKLDKTHLSLDDFPVQVDAPAPVRKGPGRPPKESKVDHDALNRIMSENGIPSMMQEVKVS